MKREDSHMATARRKQLLIEGIDLEELNPRSVSRLTRLTAAGMGATIAASRFAAIAGGAVLGVGGFGGVALAADDQYGKVAMGWDTGPMPDGLNVPNDQFWATSWDDASPKSDKNKKDKKAKEPSVKKEPKPAANTSSGNNNNNHANVGSRGGGEPSAPSNPSHPSAPSHPSEPSHPSKANANADKNHQAGANAGARANNGHDKVGVCHATGSASNPFVHIVIDRHGWENGHEDHQDGRDFLADSSSACEAAAAVIVNAQANAGAQNQGTGGGQGFVTGVGGVIGTAPNNGVIQSQIFTPGQPVTQEQAQAIADHVGGGLGAEDVMAMTPEEVAGVIGAAGMEGTVGGVFVAPAALPQAGDFLPIAGQAVLGFGALMAGAGALMRRMRR